MKKLSNAEFEVMKIIWKKEKTTSTEIIQALQNTNWNDNTIRTLIKRLLSKKAIGILKKEKKSYIYKPLIDENEYILKCSKDFVQQFFNGSIMDCINFLLKNNIEKIRQELD